MLLWTTNLKNIYYILILRGPKADVFVDIIKIVTMFIKEFLKG